VRSTGVIAIASLALLLFFTFTMVAWPSQREISAPWAPLQEDSPLLAGLKESRLRRRYATGLASLDPSVVQLEDGPAFKDGVQGGGGVDGGGGGGGGGDGGGDAEPGRRRPRAEGATVGVGAEGAGVGEFQLSAKAARAALVAAQANRPGGATKYDEAWAALRASRSWAPLVRSSSRPAPQPRPFPAHARTPSPPPPAPPPHPKLCGPAHSITHKHGCVRLTSPGARGRTFCHCSRLASRHGRGNPPCMPCAGGGGGQQQRKRCMWCYHMRGSA
jgi:hypothetical protein